MARVFFISTVIHPFLRRNLKVPIRQNILAGGHGMTGIAIKHRHRISSPFSFFVYAILIGDLFRTIGWTLNWFWWLKGILRNNLGDGDNFQRARVEASPLKGTTSKAKFLRAWGNQGNFKLHPTRAEMRGWITNLQPYCLSSTIKIVIVPSLVRVTHRCAAVAWGPAGRGNWSSDGTTHWVKYLSLSQLLNFIQNSSGKRFQGAVDTCLH